MKKYLITSAAALALCGLITSCSHDIDGLTPEESVAATYEKAFITAFGQPAPDQTWGFGTSVATSRAMTRDIDGITKPSFSTKANIDNLTAAKYTINKPSLGKTLLDEITNNSGVDYAANDNSLSNNGTYYINSSSDLQNPQNFDNLTIYINDNNMTFSKSLKSGGTIVICKDKNVTLNSVNENNTIYVAPGATLNFNSDVTLKNCRIFLASGSTLNAKWLTVMTQNNGTCEIVNDGGTINVGTQNESKSICFDNFLGTFWNGGTLKVYGRFYTQNGEGGKFFNGQNCNFTATEIYLYKSTNFRNEGTITCGTFNADQYGHKVYNSGTITCDEIFLAKELTVWNEGTFTAKNVLSPQNNDVYIYNGTTATMTLNGLDLANNKQLLVNDGALDIKGNIIIEKGTAELINNKTLTATGGLSMYAAYAKFHNSDNSVATLGGKVYIENSDCRWMNDGFFTCTEFEVTGGTGNPFVFNNCRLTVNGLFHMNHGYFVLDGGATAGAAVVCNSFTWTSDNFFMMGNKSLLRVKGQLLGANRNSDPHYGFHGLGDIAVIEAGSVEKDSEGKYRIAYYGNLYIDTKNHFEQGQASDGPWYYHDSTVKFSFTDEKDEHVVASAAPTIPGNEQSCNPGYNEDHEPTGDVVRVIAEDLTASAGNDFDFNDVVFDVELKDNNVVYVYVRAAGGTLPLYLGEDDEAVEVHGLFGQDTGIMINTGGTTKGYANCIDNLAPKGISLRNPLAGQADATNVRQVAKAIKVTVIKKVNGTSTPCLLKAEQGEATAKLCVGTDYQYTEGGKTYPCLTERTDIKGQFKYMPENNHPHKGEGKFPLYVQGIFGDNWYQSAAEPLPQSNN